jgi:hypothetical protein
MIDQQISSDKLIDQETMNITISIYSNNNFVKPKENLQELHKKLQPILMVKI